MPAVYVEEHVMSEFVFWLTDPIFRINAGLAACLDLYLDALLEETECMLNPNLPAPEDGWC